MEETTISVIEVCVSFMQAFESHQTATELRLAADGLARRATLLYRCRALAWAIASGLVVTLAVILVDYALHLDERGLRWLLSLLWLGGLVAIGSYWLREVWLFKLSPLEVVGWVEKSRPDMADRLTRHLATAQLPDRDERYGSLELRQAALMRDDQAWRDIRWTEYLDHRATWWAALASVACIGGLSCLILLNQSVFGLGLERILAPWRVAPWPRADQLELMHLPEIIPMGSDLEVQVIDRRPPLPTDIQLQIRSRNPQSKVNPAQVSPAQVSPAQVSPAQVTIQRFPMRIIDEMAIVTLPGMEHDFQLRAVGGDDHDMPWMDIQVARRPILEEHLFSIVPPKYTQQPELNLVGQRLEILAGSQVTFTGRFDVPVHAVKALPAPSVQAELTSSSSSASIDRSPAENSSTLAWSAQLAADGKSFELRVGGETPVIHHDQQWRLAVTTKEGLQLEEERLWQMRVVADQAPFVTLHPLESTYMTRQAQLAVTGQALDDLGLVEVALLWRIDSTAEGTRQQLWASEPDASHGSVSGAKAVDLATTWPGEHFHPVVGQRIVLELEATDTAGQVARSLPQTLQVQDDQSVLSELQSAQAESLSSLREIAQAQARATHSLQRTQEVVVAANQVGTAEAETLATTLQLQRSVADALADSPEGLRKRLANISQQLQQNGLGNSQLARDLATLSAQLERLQLGRVAPALEALEQANQSMRSAAEQSSGTAQSLADLEQATQASRNLSSDINSLAQSVVAAESLASLQKRTQRLLAEQLALRNATEQLQVDAVLESNSPGLTSRRAGLRSDQQELTRNVTELTSRMDQELEMLAKQADPSQQQSAELLQRARRQLVDGQAGQRMRQAVEQFDSNQLAKATELQTQASQALQQTLHQFSAGADGGLQSTASAMERLTQELEQLAEAQSELAQRFNQASTALPADAALAQQQSQLSVAVEQLAQRQAVSPSQSLRSQLAGASQAASRAARAANEQDLPEASRQANSAAQQLRSAQELARQKAQQLREQLSQQQLLDLATLIDNLVARQEPIVQQLLQLTDPVKEASGVIELTAAQQLVLTQLRQGLAQTAAPPAFDWLLEQCEQELIRGVAALQRQRIHPQALNSAQAALDMLTAAQTALAQSPSLNQTPSQGDVAENQADADTERKRPGITLSSIKLLRAMQEILNNQANELQRQTPVDEVAMAQLANRQQALADQVQSFIQQAAAAQSTMSNQP